MGGNWNMCCDIRSLISQLPHDHHHHHTTKYHTSLTYTAAENGDMLDEVRQKIAQIKKSHHKPSSLAGTPLQAGSQTSITHRGGMLLQLVYYMDKITYTGVTIDHCGCCWY